MLFKQTEPLLKPKDNYTYLVVHSVQGIDGLGRKKKFIRPIPGEVFDSSLNVACAKNLIEDYPLGTCFRIKAKVTDMSGTPFIYSYFGWPYEVLSRSNKA